MRKIIAVLVSFCASLATADTYTLAIRFLQSDSNAPTIVLPEGYVFAWKSGDTLIGNMSITNMAQDGQTIITTSSNTARYATPASLFGDLLPVLPAGIIVMWSGTLATIPAGWALCNGTQGTPDLRDKFIKGWSQGVNPGGTGGSVSNTPVGAISAPTFTGTPFSSVINHTHAVAVTDPGHAHLTQRYPTATGGSSGFTIDTSMSGTLADNTQPVKTNTTGITATTANPVGGVATITPAGTVNAPVFTGTAASNEPEFFRLAYIMKTAL